jgi:uncharacterized protein CbrC (UPF0167 family)
MSAAPAVALPAFRYHPDPRRTGSVVASETECVCCGQSRGYVYAIAPITEENIEAGALCPWCIADGSAAREYAATFIDGEDVIDLIPADAFATLAERTPGYAAWQNEEWRVCCDDAAAFLGPFGYAEIQRAEEDGFGADLEGILIEYVTSAMEIEDDRASDLVESLDRDRGPTAYLFQCLHCKAYTFHVDFP